MYVSEKHHALVQYDFNFLLRQLNDLQKKYIQAKSICRKSLREYNEHDFESSFRRLSKYRLYICHYFDLYSFLVIFRIADKSDKWKSRGSNHKLDSGTQFYKKIYEAVKRW